MAARARLVAFAVLLLLGAYGPCAAEDAEDEPVDPPLAFSKLGIPPSWQNLSETGPASTEIPTNVFLDGIRTSIGYSEP